jgi:hypothetical protein
MNFLDLKLPERFWDKVAPEPTSGCWLWTASLNGPGYGQFFFAGKLQMAHRVAYRELVAPPPRGLDLDHLCRTRCCVNPAHLEPVTRSTNLRRSPIVHAATLAARTACRRGHPFTAESSYIDKRTGTSKRRCSTCRTELRRGLAA